MLEAFARKGLWLLQLNTQIHQREGWDDAQRKRQSPNQFQVVWSNASDDHGYEGTNDEAKVDLGVGEETEPVYTSVKHPIRT